MQEELKNIVQNYLSALDFVTWDRYILTNQGITGLEEYRVYGWIAREEDAYKDFVVLTVTEYTYNMHDVWYITSSAHYSEHIGKILGAVDHNPCIRVEDTFGITNMVELHPSKKI